MRLPVVGDRAFALDACVIVAVSVAICLWAQELTTMSVLVPALLSARFVLWARLPETERGSRLGPELVLFGVCTLLGAFNDWNSVVHHRIYDYTVPAELPSFSTIPFWMLLFWGMILRFFVTLFRWRRLSPPERPDDRVFLPGKARSSAGLKLGLELGLVLVTRQCIYRAWDDPLWSWLPFAVCLVVYVALFRPTRHDGWLVGLFLAGGPLIEVLYINVGHLHAYHLGWLGGVPLWIVLWWLVIALVWKDLSGRLQLFIGRYFPGRPVRSVARSAASAASGRT